MTAVATRRCNDRCSLGGLVTRFLICVGRPYKDHSNGRICRDRWLTKKEPFRLSIGICPGA
jgi:hypothetical protein